MPYPDFTATKDAIKNPFYEALEAIVQRKPPIFCKGVFNSSELNDEKIEKLQDWCCNNAKPYWSTGIAILEAADSIVYEAVSNANIRSKEEL